MDTKHEVGFILTYRFLSNRGTLLLVYVMECCVEGSVPVFVAEIKGRRPTYPHIH